MLDTHLGPVQVLFVRNHHEIEVDLVLSGPATVEGRPLVPGSPVAVSLVAPASPRERRRMVQKLLAWADDASCCRSAIDIDEGQAVLVLGCHGARVRGVLTDLDVLFAGDLPSA